MPQLVALPCHHVHRVVQHAFDDEIALLRQQHVGFGKILERDGHRTDVIMVTMRDRDGVHFLPGDGRVKWQRGAAVPFGVHAGVEQDAVAFDFHKPGTGADVRVGIEIDDVHERQGKGRQIRLCHQINYLRPIAGGAVNLRLIRIEPSREFLQPDEAAEES